MCLFRRSRVLSPSPVPEVLRKVQWGEQRAQQLCLRRQTLFGAGLYLDKLYLKQLKQDWQLQDTSKNIHVWVFLVETSKTNLKINRDNKKKTRNKGPPRITFILGVPEGYVHVQLGCTQMGKIKVGLGADLKAFPKATHKSTASKVQGATSLKIKSHSHMMVWKIVCIRNNWRENFRST